MADQNELEDQVTRLTALVEQMSARIAKMEGKPEQAAPDAPRSRRDLLKMGGAAALGAVGAAALRALPAAAATGDPVLAGNANSASASTTLAGTGTGLGASVEVLGVQAVDFDSAALATALGTTGELGGAIQGLGGFSDLGAVKPNFRDGVDGWASGATSFGVYGLSDAGVGVTGESSAGASFYAAGSGRIQQHGHALSGGVPDYSPFADPLEQVRDAAGTLWLSNGSGTWRRASTFEVFTSPKRVYGKGVVLPKGAIIQNIDAKTSINLTPTGVPAGATAAWCAVASQEPAVLSIYPAGTPDPHFAAFGQMGTAGISLQVVYMMVPLNASGKFSFTNVKTSARIYFDVWGYLTQS